jgi:hypothetical protein
MTKLLELAITQVRDLPEETQELAADALFMVIEHVNDHNHYRLTDEQIEGVHHAMEQAEGNSRRIARSGRSSADRYEGPRHR